MKSFYAAVFYLGIILRQAELLSIGTKTLPAPEAATRKRTDGSRYVLPRGYYRYPPGVTDLDKILRQVRVPEKIEDQVAFKIGRDKLFRLVNDLWQAGRNIRDSFYCDVPAIGLYPGHLMFS